MGAQTLLLPMAALVALWVASFASADRARHPSLSSPASYAPAPRHHGHAVWRGAGGVLYRIGGGALG